MLTVYRIDDEEVVTREQADLIDIGFRCLYAELVHARVEKSQVSLERAKDRAVSLLKSRVTAYGEKWRFHFNTRTLTSKTCVVPPEIQKGLAWIDIDNCGTHALSPVLLGVPGPPRGRPGRRVGKPKRKEATTPHAAPTRAGEQPRTGAAQPYAGPRLAADLETEGAFWTRMQSAAARMDAGAEHVSDDDSEGGMMREDGGHSGREDTRDMSGDARTYEQARRARPREYAECTLSAFRNVLRDEYASRDSLACMQVREADESAGGNEEVARDLRFPDWERILSTITNEDEVVVTFFPHRMPQHTQWLDARVAVVRTASPNHVVAVWNHGDGRSLRVYDNDSSARARGTYTLIPTSVRWEGRAVAVAARGSPLHHTAIAHIPQRRERRREREDQGMVRPPDDEGSEDEWPVYDNPIAQGGESLTSGYGSDSDP